MKNAILTPSPQSSDKHNRRQFGQKQFGQKKNTPARLPVCSEFRVLSHDHSCRGTH